MLMSACLPVSIHPRIVAKRRCVFQLGFGDSGSVTLKGSVVFHHLQNDFGGLRRHVQTARALFIFLWPLPMSHSTGEWS